MVERDLAKVEVAGSSPVIRSIFGPVVQLVRTLACHARGQGFESPSGRHFADLAHLVERDLAKVEVAGSSPVIRSMKKTVSTVFFCFCPKKRSVSPSCSWILGSVVDFPPR